MKVFLSLVRLCLGGDAYSSPVPRGIPDLGNSGTGPEPVSESREAGVGPAPVFVEPLGDPFVNLDWLEDVAEEDSLGSPIEIIQTKPIQLPNPSVEKPKRCIKTPAGRIDLPLVRRFKALRSGASLASPQPVASPSPTSTQTSIKPSAKPSTKSSTKFTREPSHKSPKTPKYVGPSEHEDTQVEETVLSPAPPSAKDKGTALEEQLSK